MVLSTAQMKMLRNVRDQGHAFAGVGLVERAGGSKLRMAQRLAAAGLLSPSAPYEITDHGRSELQRVLKGPKP